MNFLKVSENLSFTNKGLERPFMVLKYHNFSNLDSYYKI